MTTEFDLPADGSWAMVGVDARAAIREALAAHAARVGVPTEAISKIVIVDAARFGAAIKSIAADERWTASESATGVAKTIPRVDAVGVRSTVVIWAELFAGIVELGVSPSSPSNRERDHMCSYIVCHEFGHCKDNWLRGLAVSRPLSLWGEFRVKSVASYYIDILLSEFAACAHSAKALDAEILQWEEANMDILPGMLEALRKMRGECASEPQSLWTLAFTASGTLWTALIQFAKLVGSHIEHPEMPVHVPLPWGEHGIADRDIFEREEEILLELWRKYPSWENGLSDELFSLWYALADNQGYGFVETSNGDALFLR